MEKIPSETTLVIDLNHKPMHNPTGTTHDELVEELNKMKWENKKLNEMLTILCRNYHDFVKKECCGEEFLNYSSRKRKSFDDHDIGNIKGFTRSCCDECSPAGRPKEIKSNVSRVHVRIDPSDTSLIVKDGYQWRKYGQKVTKDNPSPRAYYKCSMAPSCPVKKKVQRSANDPSLLVATYEDHHNHHPPGSETSVAGANSSPGTTPIGCSAPNLDLTDPVICDRIQTEDTAIPQYFVEQMASSLTRNQSFTAALAAAITGKILDDGSEDNDDSSFSNSRVFSV